MYLRHPSPSASLLISVKRSRSSLRMCGSTIALDTSTPAAPHLILNRNSSCSSTEPSNRSVKKWSCSNAANRPAIIRSRKNTGGSNASIRLSCTCGNPHFHPRHRTVSPPTTVPLRRRPTGRIARVASTTAKCVESAKQRSIGARTSASSRTTNHLSPMAIR